MSDVVWHWRKGDKRIYTRRDDVAERAMRDGFLVMVLSERIRIFRK